MNGDRGLLLATVTAVKDSTVYYPSCHQCHTKLLLEHAKVRYTCRKCGISRENKKVQFRYCLHIEVTDGTACCPVTVFGSNLDPFFGCSATYLQRCISSAEPGQQPEELLLEAMQAAFVGQVFIFGFPLKHKLASHMGKQANLRAVTACNRLTGADTNIIASQMVLSHQQQEFTPVLTIMQNMCFKNDTGIDSSICYSSQESGCSSLIGLSKERPGVSFDSCTSYNITSSCDTTDSTDYSSRKPMLSCDEYSYTSLSNSSRYQSGLCLPTNNSIEQCRRSNISGSVYGKPVSRHKDLPSFVKPPRSNVFQGSITMTNNNTISSPVSNGLSSDETLVDAEDYIQSSIEMARDGSDQWSVMLSGGEPNMSDQALCDQLDVMEQERKVPKLDMSASAEQASFDKTDDNIDRTVDDKKLMLDLTCASANGDADLKNLDNTHIIPTSGKSQHCESVYPECNEELLQNTKNSGNIGTKTSYVLSTKQGSSGQEVSLSQNEFSEVGDEDSSYFIGQYHQALGKNTQAPTKYHASSTDICPQTAEASISVQGDRFRSISVKMDCQSVYDQLTKGNSRSRDLLTTQEKLDSSVINKDINKKNSAVDSRKSDDRTNTKLMCKHVDSVSSSTPTRLQLCEKSVPGPTVGAKTKAASYLEMPDSEDLDAFLEAEFGEGSEEFFTQVNAIMPHTGEGRGTGKAATPTDSDSSVEERSCAKAEIPQSGLSNVSCRNSSELQTSPVDKDNLDTKDDEIPIFTKRTVMTESLCSQDRVYVHDSSIDSNGEKDHSLGHSSKINVTVLPESEDFDAFHCEINKNGEVKCNSERTDLETDERSLADHSDDNQTEAKHSIPVKRSVSCGRASLKPHLAVRSNSSCIQKDDANNPTTKSDFTHVNENICRFTGEKPLCDALKDESSENLMLNDGSHNIRDHTFSKESGKRMSAVVTIGIIAEDESTSRVKNTIPDNLSHSDGKCDLPISKNHHLDYVDQSQDWLYSQEDLDHSGGSSQCLKINLSVTPGTLPLTKPVTLQQNTLIKDKPMADDPKKMLRENVSFSKDKTEVVNQIPTQKSDGECLQEETEDNVCSVELIYSASDCSADMFSNSSEDFSVIDTPNMKCQTHRETRLFSVKVKPQVDIVSQPGKTASVNKSENVNNMKQTDNRKKVQINEALTSYNCGTTRDPPLLKQSGVTTQGVFANHTNMHQKKNTLNRTTDRSVKFKQALPPLVDSENVESQDLFSPVLDSDDHSGTLKYVNVSESTPIFEGKSRVPLRKLNFNVTRSHVRTSGAKGSLITENSISSPDLFLQSPQLQLGKSPGPETDDDQSDLSDIVPATEYVCRKGTRLAKPLSCFPMVQKLFPEKAASESSLNLFSDDSIL